MSTRLMLAETPYLRAQPLDFQVGDTVDVATKIVEGDKERIQLFTGRVIRRRGQGLSANFTVRRIVMGEGVLDHPHYTRPLEFQGRGVPDVLRTGDHGAIARWRHEQALARTRARRPDLLHRPSEPPRPTDPGSAAM